MRRALLILIVLVLAGCAAKQNADGGGGGLLNALGSLFGGGGGSDPTSAGGRTEASWPFSLMGFIAMGAGVASFLIFDKTKAIPLVIIGGCIAGIPILVNILLRPFIIPVAIACAVIGIVMACGVAFTWWQNRRTNAKGRKLAEFLRHSTNGDSGKETRMAAIETTAKVLEAAGTKKPVDITHLSTGTNP